MKILLMGNSIGIDAYLLACGTEGLVGIVAASNRANDIDNCRSLALGRNLPFLIQPRAMDCEQYETFLNDVRMLKADYIFVNCYSMILDKAILEIPRFGAINVHFGLLPQYRGANVINWVIINGESESGVTFHEIDEGIDTGDIVMQRSISILEQDTVVSLREKLVDLSISMIRSLIQKLKNGESLGSVPQKNSQARYWPRRNPEDGCFEWSWETRRIHDLIRALVSPWPGAFFYDRNGDKVTISSYMSMSDIEIMKNKYFGEVADE